MNERTCATCPNRVRTEDRDHCIHCQQAGLDIPFTGRWVPGSTWGVLVSAREGAA